MTRFGDEEVLDDLIRQLSSKQWPAYLGRARVIAEAEGREMGRRTTKRCIVAARELLGLPPDAQEADRQVVELDSLTLLPEADA